MALVLGCFEGQRIYVGEGDCLHVERADAGAEAVQVRRERAGGGVEWHTVGSGGWTTLEGVQTPTGAFDLEIQASKYVADDGEAYPRLRYEAPREVEIERERARNGGD